MVGDADGTEKKLQIKGYLPGILGSKHLRTGSDLNSSHMGTPSGEATPVHNSRGVDRL